jgi:tryptophan synthase alpha chain
MNRIDQKFQEDKKLLSIYFSAGYPSLEDTVPILKNLQAAGVDMVEIGLPFSDPLADGPTIQESSTQALAQWHDHRKTVCTVGKHQRAH